MPDETRRLLSMDSLVTGYGKKQVLNGVNLDMAPGEIVALIGHNGAGKSTLLKAVFGLLPIWEGQVALYGKPLRSPNPRELLRVGIVYVPQGNRVFTDMAWGIIIWPPLALVGETATAMAGWVQAALDGTQPLTPITTLDTKGQEVVLGHGYETSRTCTAALEGESLQWTERGLVVKSEAYAQTLERGLEKRLATATAKLRALTPPRGRGKRQITDEARSKIS